MQLDRDQSVYQFNLRAYRPGCLLVNDQEYLNSIILCPQRIISPWRPSNISEMTTTDLELILELKPEILLLGTGNRHHIVPTATLASLINSGVAVEVMSTAAACRTFRLLAADSRPVAAALLIN